MKSLPPMAVWPGLAWLVLVSWMGVSAAPAPAQEERLDVSELQRWTRRAEALGARTGVMVWDLEGGPVFACRAGEAFAPASNMKLLSAAATLAGLGPDYEFCTIFRLREGKLVVEAGGDPNWITGGEYDPTEIFGHVVQALKQRGIDRVQGIELDPGPYRGAGRPPYWPPDQREAWYCAPTAGLVLEEGCFSVRIEARDGEHASLELVAPRAARRFDRRLPLTSERRKGSFYGVRDAGDELQPRGNFYRRSPPVVVRAAVADPEAWFRDALLLALERGGIAVDPGPGAGAPAAKDAVLLAERTPLAAALQRSLQDSSNFAAEQCLRVLAAEKRKNGSLAAGVEEMAVQLRGLAGHLPPDTRLVDGSGLSWENRVTPAHVVAVLRAVLGGPAGGGLRSWLPVAGRSGTLEDRFSDSPVAGRVRAKTGWIRGASALSGVLQLRDGRVRVFSILMNYDRSVGGLNKELKRLQERLVEAMDRGGDGE